MPTIKLTARALDSLPAPAKGRLEFWDATLPGFGLRITDKGAKSWVVMYRVNGKLRRLTLGSYPKKKLADAREEARAAMQAAENGDDPAAEKKAARQEVPDSFGAVVEDYFKRDASRRNKSWAETRRLILRDCEAWADRPVKDITRREVRDLLDAIVDRGSPVMANRLFAYIRRVFNWAVDREIITESPCRGLKKPSEERSRDRVLTDGEVVEFWHAAEALGYPFGPLYRLALLTAQRRGEVAAARWQDIDLKRGVWTLPREQTKSDRAHEVPLSPLAVAELERLPRFKSSGLLFPSRTKAQAAGKDPKRDAGDHPVSGWSRSKRRLDEIILEARQKAAEGAEVEPMQDWTIHDLRRTAASGMARLGIPPHIVEKLLNHSEGEISGVAAVYNRYGYEDEKRRAAEAWAQFLQSLFNPEDGGNVVKMERQA